MNKVKWSASLSNGETIYEDKGNFQEIEGALSPWQRLLLYFGTSGATITSLSLYTDDGRRWNLPSAGKNPKFREFDTAQKPLSYKMFRKKGMDIRKDSSIESEDLFTVIEAVYENGNTIQVWVDDSSLTSWSIIK